MEITRSKASWNSSGSTWQNWFLDARRLSTIQFIWVFLEFVNIWTLQVYQWDLCNIASDDIEVGESSLPGLLLDIFSLLVRVGQSFDSAAWEPEQRQYVKARSLMNLCMREKFPCIMDHKKHLAAMKRATEPHPQPRSRRSIPSLGDIDKIESACKHV